LDPYFTNATDAIRKAGCDISTEDQVVWLLEAQAQALLALTEVVAEIGRKLEK
jgi:hypothetical protein